MALTPEEEKQPVVQPVAAPVAPVQEVETFEEFEEPAAEPPSPPSLSENPDHVESNYQRIAAYGESIDRFDVAQAAKAARKQRADEQKREQEAKRLQNYKIRQHSEQTGAEYIQDEKGVYQPKIDPDTGLQKYRESAPIRYDEKGRPYKYTDGGNIVDPDAKAAWGENPDDPNDPLIYRKTSATPWEAYDPEEGIKSANPELIRASAKALHGRELRKISLREDEISLEKTRPGRVLKSPLTPEKRAEIAATRESLAQPIPRPEPKTSFFGGVNQQATAQAEAAWMQEENLRVADLAAADAAIAEDDQLSSFAQETHQLTAQRIELQRSGPAGYLARRRKESAASLAAMPADQAAAEVETRQGDIARQDEDIARRDADLTSRAAALQAEQEKGPTLARSAEIERERAAIRADSVALQDAVASRNSVADDTRAGLQERETQRRAEIKASRDAMRADPEGAKTADELDAIDREAEFRSAAVESLPDGEARTAARESLRTETEGKYKEVSRRQFPKIARTEAELRRALAKMPEGDDKKSVTEALAEIESAHGDDPEFQKQRASAQKFDAAVQEMADLEKANADVLKSVRWGTSAPDLSGKAGRHMANTYASILRRLDTPEQIDAFDAAVQGRRVTDAMDAVSREKLNLGDKLQELRANPTKLLPFIGSIPELAGLADIRAAAGRVSEGKGTNNDFAALAEFTAREGREKTIGYNVGEVLSMLPGFAGELLLTGGIYTAAKTGAVKGASSVMRRLVSKSASEWLEKKAVEQIGSQGAKALLGQLAVRAPATLVGAAAQTPFAAALRAPTSYAERTMPKVRELVRSGDGSFNFLMEDGENPITAAVNSFGDAYVETFSERTGAGFDIAAKILGKAVPAKLRSQLAKAFLFGKWMEKNPGSKLSKVGQVLKDAGWNGFLQEIGEERVGDMARGFSDFVQGVAGGQGFAEAAAEATRNNTPTGEQWLTELISFAIPAGGIAALNGVRAGSSKTKVSAPAILPEQVAAANVAIDAWQPPSGLTPEGAQLERTAARASLKLIAGQPLESLLAAERAALGQKLPDKTPRMEVVKGVPVISEGQLRRLRQVAPETADLAIRDEAAVREQLLTPSPDEDSKAPQQQGAPADTSGQNPGASGTDSAPPQNPAGKAVTDRNAPPIPVGKFGALITPAEKDSAKSVADRLTATGVKPAVAKTFAEYFVRREGTADFSEEKIAAAVSEFEQAGGRENPAAIIRAVRAGNKSQEPQVEAIHRKVVSDLGEKYTSLPAAKRKSLDAVIRHRIAPELLTYAGAVQEVMGKTAVTGGGGVGISRGGKFNFNLPDILKRANLANLSDDVAVERIINEEIGHLANIAALSGQRTARTKETGDAYDLALTEAREIFTTLPKEVQDHVRTIRTDGAFKEEPDALGMEFFRMLLQRDIAVQDGKIVTADGRVLTEQTLDASFLARMRQIFARLLRTFDALQETLTRSLSAEGRAPEEIAALVSRIETARAESLEIFKSFRAAGDTARSEAYEKAYANASTPPAPAGGTPGGATSPLPSGSGSRGVGPAVGAGNGNAGGTVPSGTGAGIPSGSTATAVAPEIAAQLAERDRRIAALEAEKANAEAATERALERRNFAVQRRAEIAGTESAILAKVPEDARTLAADVLTKVQMGSPSYVLGANRERLPASYIAAAPDAVQTSHAGADFHKNPLYGGENTRPYHSDETEQNKVLSIAKPGALDEDAIVTDAKSAADGPAQVILAIFNDTEGNLRVSLQTAGGNGREQGVNLAPLEDQERLSSAWAARGDSFGLNEFPDGWRGYRFLGVYDLRDEATNREYLQLVDKLNPNQGVVQDTAARADIDAALNIPVERLVGIPLTLSPERAREVMIGLVRDAEKLGLDRNLVAGLVKNPAQSQFYIQRLLIASAFRSKALGEFVTAAPWTNGHTSIVGLIKSATATALQLRVKGHGNIADAIGRTLERVTEYARAGKKINIAIRQAADQVEMGEDGPLIQQLAAAIAQKVAFLPQNKRGIIPVDAEESMAGFDDLMADIARGVEIFTGEAEMFGPAPTIAETIEGAISAHFRKTSQLQSRGSVSYASGIDKEADARGAFSAGVPMGTTAQILAKNEGVKNLFKTALRAGRKIFIDSGAFGASRTGKSVDFDAIFETYLELADSAVTDGQLTIVGPDILGDQTASARLVRKYSESIRETLAKGARVILPVQHGDLSIEDYLESVGFSTDEIAVGIPANKFGYPRKLLRQEISDAEVKDVHFLGMSDKNSDAEMLIDAAKESGAENVTLDANRIRSKAGRSILTTSPDSEEFRADFNDLLHDNYGILLDLAENERTVIGRAVLGNSFDPSASWDNTILQIETLRPGFLDQWLNKEAEIDRLTASNFRASSVQRALEEDKVPVAKSAEPQLLARGPGFNAPRRIRALQRKRQSEGLSRFETNELTQLELESGQDFMEFFGQVIEDNFALESQSESVQPAEAEEADQLQLLSRPYPGPLKIEPMPGLSPEQVSVEEKFSTWLQESPDRAAAAYAAIPETENGRVIDMDEARKLSPDYNATRKARTLHTLSVQKVAQALVMQRLFVDALSSLKAGDVMAFTAGGPGSGKGNIRRDMPAEWNAPAAIYDGVLRKFDVAVDAIETARAAGAKSQIWYVHAPVEAATVQAMRRAEFDGRALPLSVLASGHFEAQQTIIRLLEHYAGDPDVTIRVLDNTGPRLAVVTNPLTFLRGESIIYGNANEVETRARAAFDGNIAQLTDPDARAIFSGAEELHRETASRGSELRGQRSVGEVPAESPAPAVEEPASTPEPPTPPEAEQSAVADVSTELNARPAFTAPVDDPLSETYRNLDGLLEENPQPFVEENNEYQPTFNFDAPRPGNGLAAVEQPAGGVSPGSGVPPVAPYRPAARLLGLAISFVRSAKTGALLGKSVKTAKEVAVVSQIYRDPRFETLRVYYVDAKNIVVHETAVSARLVAQSPLLPGGNRSIEEFVKIATETMSATGAAGFYMVHNHPSGVPTASGADIRLTAAVRRLAGNALRGHVIINSGAYSAISEDGAYLGVHDLPAQFAKDKIFNPSVPHMALSSQVAGPEDVATVAKMVEQSPDAVTLIGSDAKGKVRAVMALDRRTLDNPRRLAGILARVSRTTGSYGVFLAGLSESDYSQYSPLFKRAIKEGFLVDVLSASGRSIHNETAVSPNPNKPFGRDVVGRAFYEDPALYQSGFDFDAIPEDRPTAASDGALDPLDRFKAGMPQAMKIAEGFTNIPGVDLNAVRQEARLALADAARKFDAGKGKPFGAYAGVAVRNRLRTLYRNEDARRARFPVSLDEPVGEDETETRGDFAQDTRTPSALDAAARDEAQTVLESVLSALPERHQIAARGFYNQKTFEEIGRELGVTKQRAAVIQAAAFRDMREMLAERGVSSVDQILARPAESTEEDWDDIDALLRDLDAEIPGYQDAALAEEAAGAKKTMGRPDLAFGAENADIRGLDQYYTDKFLPETEAQWENQAREMLDRDYAGTRQAIQSAGLAGESLSPAQTKAADIIARDLRRAVATEGTEEARRASNVFWYAYRNTGATAARSMAARHDPFKTPAERHREFLMEIVSKPRKAAQKAIDAAPTNADQSRRIAELEKQIATARDQLDAAEVRRIEAELDAQRKAPTKEYLIDKETAALLEKLKAAGITPQDILGDRVALSLVDKNALAFVRQILARGAGSDARKRAFDLILKNKSFAEIASQTGLSETAVKQVKADTIKALRDQHFAKFEAGAKADSPSLLTGAKVSIDTAEKEFAKWLKKLGIVDDAVQGKAKFNIDDPAHVMRLARAIQSARGEATWGDMVFEYWIMNILSGPMTHVANVTGNAGMAMVNLTLQRGMEAMVNSVVRDSKSARAGEFKYLLKGLMPGLAKGYARAVEAWSTEHDFFEHTVLGTPLELNKVEKMAVNKSAIPGAVGKIVRVPGRALLFADAFFKSTISQMEAGAFAYRIAKAQGLKGKALARRVEILTSTRNEIITEYLPKANPGKEVVEFFARQLARLDSTLDADDMVSDTSSDAWIKAREQVALDAAKKDGWTEEAWERAVESAKVNTFQQDLQTTADGGNQFEDIAAKLQNARFGNKLAAFFFPFVKTPYNVFRVGLRKSPLGSINFATQMAKGLYSLKDGKAYLESHPEFVRDLSEQLLTWGAFALLFAAAQGDEDDDDKLLLITGSQPRSEASEGEKNLNARAYGGEYVIRFGGRGGISVPYGRLEPFATVLGATTDLIRSIKQNGTMAENMASLWNFMSAQVNNKSMLQGMQNVTDLANGRRNPVGTAWKTALQFFVPNLIRQPMRNLDDYARDSRTAPAIYTMFPTGANAEPQVTPQGQEVAKGFNPLARVFFQSPLATDAVLNQTDALLIRWNQRNPSESWAPKDATVTYRSSKGKTVQMTAEEARVFRLAAGRKASAKLRTIVNARNAANPTLKDIQAVRKAFEDARDEAREIMFSPAQVLKKERAAAGR